MAFPKRFRAALTSAILALTTGSAVAASCGPDKLGTARTIALDPAEHRSFEGHESGLGLRDKEVILTFDDGPLGGYTTSILKTLKKECVKATFFYVGKMAKSQPHLVRRVARAGHTVGHHTWDHDRLPTFDIAEAEKRVDKGIATLDRIVYGEATDTPRVPFFRYPYLAHNAETDAMLARKGLISFHANIDSLDWKRDTPDAVHDRIMKRLKREGRGIVLMHDIQGRTVKMLPRLLKSLKAGGYRVAHIVPKGGAVPSAAPKVPTDPVVVASLTTDDAPIEDNSDPVIAKKVSSLLDLKPARVTRTHLPRAGVTVVRTPPKVAEADEAQLAPVAKLAAKPAEAKPRKKARKKSKAVQVAALRVKKKRALRKNKTKWKLRRTQWIIN